MLVFGESGLATKAAVSTRQLDGASTISTQSTYLRSHVGSWQMYGRLPVWIRRWRAKLDDYERSVNAQTFQNARGKKKKKGAYV